MKKYLLTGLLLSSANKLCASETIGVNSMGSYSLDAIKIVLSLLFVLSIFYAGVNLFKKYLSGSFKSNSIVKVIGGQSLGGKEKLVLVEAGDVNLLLGVSSAGISTLHRFDKQEIAKDQLAERNKLLDFDHHLEKHSG